MNTFSSFSTLRQKILDQVDTMPSLNNQAGVNTWTNSCENRDLARRIDVSNRVLDILQYSRQGDQDSVWKIATYLVDALQIDTILVLSLIESISRRN